MRYKRWKSLEGGKPLPTARETASIMADGEPTASQYNVCVRRWNGSRPIPIEWFQAFIDRMNVDAEQAIHWMRELNERRANYLSR